MPGNQLTRSASASASPGRPGDTTGTRHQRSATKLLRDPSSPVWIATVALFVMSLIFVPSTMASASLLTMLPFASILAIAALGQTLVVQQRGLDFSLGPMVSLGAVIATKFPVSDDSRTVVAILIVVLAALVVGVVNGVVITKFGVTPLVATLAVGAIVNGAVQSYSGGFPTSAPENLATFAHAKALGIPTTVWVGVILVVVVATASGFTVIGRRSTAVGANPATTRAAGLRVDLALIRTYAMAAVLSGIAGILLAGYLGTPNLSVGNEYLLSTVTAVVVGGTALSGGRARLVATAVAALFLTQLQQIITSLGYPASTQYLVEAVAITIAVGLRARSSASGPSRMWQRWRSSRPPRRGASGPADIG